MKINRNIIRNLVIVIILILGPISLIIGNSVDINCDSKISVHQQKDLRIKTSGFWNLTGTLIDIDGDANGVGAHNWSWAVSQDWCNGLGTDLEPYVIENVSIYAASGENSISIRDSDVFFIINNCTLKGGNIGIDLQNVNNGVIVNSDIQEFSFGIWYNNVNETVVQYSNIRQNNFNGMYIIDSNSNIILANNLTDHLGTGLGPAIYLSQSNYNEISQNYFMNNKRAIYMVDKSNHNTISYNQIHESNQNAIEAANVHKNEFLENNITTSGFHGIQLIYDSSQNHIEFNTFLDNGYSGVNLVQNASYNEIVQNFFDDNSNGIYIYASTEPLERNYIRNNEILNSNFHGIYLWGHLYNLSSNMISDNLIQGSTNEGIYITANVFNTTIARNTITSNQNGILIKDADESANIIYDNTIKNNLCGISIDDGGKNYVYNNMIKDNSELGIYTNGSAPEDAENLIYDNIFIGNTKHAKDGSMNSLWNNTETGNFWDNYTGTDLNFDGIGDQPHIIDGGIDFLPIYNTIPQIEIISPINNTLVDQDAPNFVIEINDRDIDTIWYVISGYLTQIEVLSNGTIDAAFWQSIWNDFSDGQLVIITFYVNDTLGRIATDSIQLIVNKASTGPPQGIPGFNVLIFLLFSSISLVFLITKILKKNPNF